jgi:hypothetical protein
VHLAERDPVRCKGWGRRAISHRLVLRALAVAVRLSGSTTTAFGCRSLALMSGLSWRTVATVLADLREENDPLVDLVERGRELDADRYALRLPDAHRADTTRTIWQAGRIETGHPAFLALGPVCALLYESLSHIEARPVDLERRAVLSSGAVSQALADLGAHGLAVRGRGGWRRGERTLDEVAAELDCFEHFAERVATYRDHRAQWQTFLASVRPLAAAWAELEAAFADRDRYIPESQVADAPEPDALAVPAALGVDAALQSTTAPSLAAAAGAVVGPGAAADVVPAPTPPGDDAPTALPPAARGQDPPSTAADGPAQELHDDDPRFDDPRSPVPPPVREVITLPDDSNAEAAVRGAALARRLLAEARRR